VAVSTFAATFFLAGDHSPARAKPRWDDVKAPDEAGAIRFDSKLPLLVYRLENPREGLPWNSVASLRVMFKYRLLGITPTRDGKGIAIPKGARWAVHPQRLPYTAAEKKMFTQFEEKIRGARRENRDWDSSQLKRKLILASHQLPEKAFNDLVREIKDQEIPGLLVGVDEASEDQLKKLQHATSLKTLMIRTFNSEPRQLDWIGDLEQLEVFGVYSNSTSHPISRSLVEALGKLKRLKHLHLHNVGKEHLPALSRLSRCTQLRRLAIENAGGCENKLLPAISNIRSLRRLFVDQLVVTTDELVWLARLPKLQTFEFPMHRIKPEEKARAVAIVAKFPTLFDLAWSGEDKEMVGDKSLVYLPWSTLTSDNVSRIKRYPNVRILNAKIRDASDIAPVMRSIIECSRLEALALQWKGKSKFDLSRLRKLTKLRQLTLNFPVTDGDLESLERLGRLESLYIGGSEFSEKGLLHLRKLPRLKNLQLRHSIPVNAEMMAQIGKISSLESLTVRGIGIDVKKRVVEGAAHLKGLKNLKWLDLANTTFSDKDAVAFRDLPSLQTLVLNNTKLTVNGLTEISKLPALTTLVAGPFRAKEAELHAALKDSPSLARLDFTLLPPTHHFWSYESWRHDHPTLNAPYAVRRRFATFQVEFPSVTFPDMTLEWVESW